MVDQTGSLIRTGCDLSSTRRGRICEWTSKLSDADLAPCSHWVPKKGTGDLFSGESDVLTRTRRLNLAI
jgi:hypothetical protein